MAKYPVSPCECIRRLRYLKNVALGDFYNAVQVEVNPVMGVFGLEVPEEEQIKEAIDSLAESLFNYTKYCPWEPTKEALELEKKLEEIRKADISTIENVMTGEYEWTLRDFISAVEKFMYSAIQGLYKETEGLKPEKGPFSPNPEIRNKCFALLNNLEAAKKEIVDKAEYAEGFMTAPEDLINEMDELNETQREIYNRYLELCKEEPLNIKDDLESFAYEKDQNKKSLEKYDEWTEEHREELEQDPEKWQDRMAGREHWLWEIENSIKLHQNAIDVFLETEWSNICGNLKWKE